MNSTINRFADIMTRAENLASKFDLFIEIVAAIPERISRYVIAVVCLLAFIICLIGGKSSYTIGTGNGFSLT